MVAIFNHYKGPLQYNVLGAARVVVGGEEVVEAARRVGEVLTREACRGFPLVNIWRKYDDKWKHYTIFHLYEYFYGVLYSIP